MRITTDRKVLPAFLGRLEFRLAANHRGVHGLTVLALVLLGLAGIAGTGCEAKAEAADKPSTAPPVAATPQLPREADPALEAMRQAFEKNPNPYVAVVLAQQYGAAGKKNLAAQVLKAALFLPELDALGGELRKLMREVFRQQLDRPDDVVLAFYSEHRETLLDFALAYYEVGMELGKVVALDYFLPPPGGRSKATKLLRQTPKKPETFFDSPPEKLIGIVMHLRGDFFAPRFQPEAGLHVIKEKQVDRICLIETAALPFTEYEPPAGIDRQGAIESQGAPVRRTYKPEECIVRDDFLGERPWQWKSVRVCATQLTEERLNRAIEEATR